MAIRFSSQQPGNKVKKKKKDDANPLNEQLPLTFTNPKQSNQRAPGLDVSPEDATKFVNHILEQHGETPIGHISEYLETRDPHILTKIPNFPGYRKVNMEYGRGVDHTFFQPGENRKKSLKGWARSWEHAQNGSPEKPINAGPSGGLSGVPLGKDIILPGSAEKKTRPKTQIEEPRDKSFEPMQTVPVSSTPGLFSEPTVGYTPHSRYGEPVDFVTFDPNHHCERDLPVCGSCGARALPKELNDFGDHNFDYRKECEKNRTTIGIMPKPFVN